jgi:hypothetical protein
MKNAPSVDAPNPTASTNGIQCRHITSRTAIMVPPTTFSMNAGPTTPVCRNTSNHR